MDKLIIQNRETGDHWESGNRGKPPKWVSLHPDYIKWKEQKANTPIISQSQTVQILDNVLKFWKFSSNNREFKSSTICVVAAMSNIEAMQMLNKTFKNPVTANEFASLWTLTSINGLTKEGVYERIGNEDWKERTIR
jgi:carbonic anhydrase